MQKQQENLWLVVALLGAGFLMLFAFMFVILLSFIGVEADFSKGDGIGIVEIVGPIEESRETLKQLQEFAHKDRVKAIVVRIDSPGGAVGPSQEIYSEIMKIKEQKPLAISFGSVAASGGYYIGCAGGRVFSTPGTITGSIGVIIQSMYLSELMDYIKVKPIIYKAGKHKDLLSPFRNATEQEKQMIDDMLADVHDQFITAVAEARGIPVEEVRELADGRIFTGRQALALKLVDELGSFTDAVDWAADQAGLGDDPDLIYPEKEALNYLEKMFQSAMQGAVKGVNATPKTSVEYRLAQ